jgi:hypothetical protein
MIFLAWIRSRNIRQHLSEHTIRRFVNVKTSVEENKLINKHLEECGECKMKVSEALFEKNGTEVVVREYALNDILDDEEASMKRNKLVVKYPDLTPKWERFMTWYDQHFGLFYQIFFTAIALIVLIVWAIVRFADVPRTMP